MEGIVIQPASGTLLLKADAPAVTVGAPVGGGATAVVGAADIWAESARQEPQHDLQTTTMPQLTPFPTFTVYSHHFNALPLEMVVAGCAVVVPLATARARWQSRIYFRL